MATITFWCQCQLGDVCIDALFDPLKHVSHSSQKTSGMTLSGIKYHSFWAPSTKTSPMGEEIRWMDSQCLCSSKWAFQNHLTINWFIPQMAQLLAFKTTLGSFAPIRKCWFLAWCNEIWAMKGFSSLTGHSFQIGGTTHLLLLGVDPFIVIA